MPRMTKDEYEERYNERPWEPDPPCAAVCSECGFEGEREEEDDEQGTWSICPECRHAFMVKFNPQRLG